jgi:hypothetical protein
MKNASTFRASATGLVSFALALVAGMVSIGYTQTATAVSGSGSIRTNIAPHVSIDAFVASDANSAQEALQNAVISGAEGKVLVAIASKTLPIPIIGALPVEGALRVLGKLRKHTVRGFEVEYIQGLASESALQRGETSFTVPTAGQQDASPVLLRIKPSAKDSARIVRSLHVTVKMTGSQVNPATMEILGTDQEAIPCRLEAGAGSDKILTPNSPLDSGEYAIVLVPNRASVANVPGAMVWDFRVQ